MPPSELSRAIYGAWKLALFDKKGLSFFNASEPGFWHSFHAAALIAPFYAMLLGLRYLYGLEQSPLYRLIPIEIISYAISWTIFPLIMLYITRWLDKSNHYIRLIIAYNWASVLQNGLYLVIALCGVLGIISEDTTTGLSVIVLIMIIVYLSFVVSVTLETSALITGAIVFVDLTIAILISDLTGYLLNSTS